MESIPQWARDGLDVNHEAYEKIRGEYISEINCSVTYYKHKLGFRLVGIVSDPSEIESSFEIVFPTYPPSDCGHPHIVEHSVLGGSKCYPSKQMFSQILQGGFLSFINAFTHTDRTNYLFATINDVSFKRVAHYFLESTLRPNLVDNNNIFKQEAWHLVVNPVDETTKIDKAYEFVHHGRKFSFNGIVYNEMRKRLSCITRVMRNKIYVGLYTNAYQYESSGIPISVAGVSYDSLVSFYKKFYNPTKATVYIYTSRDLYDKMDFVHQYMSNITIPPPEDVPAYTFPEEYRDEHVEIRFPYDPVGSVGDILVIAWLIDPICKATGKTFLDTTERLAWAVLEQFLMGHDKSLVYKTLIPYGTNLYPGYFDSHQQCVFMLGVQGFNPNSTKAVNRDDYIREFNNIIEKALQDKVKNGFNASELLAAINTVEFRRREMIYSDFPRGLQLSNAMHNQDIFGRDGIEALKFSEILEYLRTQVDNGYFEGLVKDRMLNNNHRVTLHAYPSEEYTIASAKESSEKIKAYVEKFSKEEVDQLEKEYLEFKNDIDGLELELDKLYLSEKNNIPRVTKLDDVSKLPIEIPSKTMLLSDGKLQDFVMGNNGIPLLIQQIPSYGILFMDLAYSLRNMNLSELQQLKILTHSWRESVDDELEQQIGIHMGGINVRIELDTPFNNAHSNNHIKPKYSNRNNSCGYLVIRTKFLAHNLVKAIELVKRFFCVKVNIDKHKEIISKMVNEMTLDFTFSGISYSQILLDSCHSTVGYANEQVGGFTFLKFLQSQSVQPNVDGLDQILEKVLIPENLIISFTGASAEKYVSDNLDLISSLHNFNGSTKSVDQNSLWANQITWNENKEFLACAVPIPSANNFVCIGGPVFDEADEIGCNLPILYWLHRCFLWKIFREKGGAYGLRANVTQSGNFYIISYADPNILHTCNTVYNLGQLIKDEVLRMKPYDFEKQKLGALSRLDSVLTPSQKGFVSLMDYISGKSPDINLEIRNAVFNITPDDYIKFADKIIKARDRFGVIILGNKDQILDKSEEVSKIFGRKLKLLELNN